MKKFKVQVTNSYKLTTQDLQQKPQKKELPKEHSCQLAQALLYQKIKTSTLAFGLQIQYASNIRWLVRPKIIFISFEAAVILGGGDQATLTKSLVMAVKGPTQQWYSSLRPKSI